MPTLDAALYTCVIIRAVLHHTNNSFLLVLSYIAPYLDLIAL